MSGAYLIKRFALPQGQATPITAPWPCNYFSLKSGSGAALILSTDPTDETQSDTLAAGAQELVAVPRIGAWRFNTGDTILYAQPQGQSDDVAVVKFVR